MKRCRIEVNSVWTHKQTTLIELFATKSSVFCEIALRNDQKLYFQRFIPIFGLNKQNHLAYFYAEKKRVQENREVKSHLSFASTEHERHTQK